MVFNATLPHGLELLAIVAGLAVLVVPRIWSALQGKLAEARIRDVAAPLVIPVTPSTVLHRMVDAYEVIAEKIGPELARQVWAKLVEPAAPVEVDAHETK